MRTNASSTYIIYNSLLRYVIDAKRKFKSASPLEQYCIIKDIYTKCKEDSLLLYGKDGMPFYYNRVLKIIIECEKILDGFYLTKQLQKMVVSPVLDKVDTAEELLNYIAYKVRTRLVRDVNDENKRFLVLTNYTIDQIDLTNKCYIVCQLVANECKKLGLKYRIVRIDPGFNESMELFDGTGYHYFAVIEVMEKEYLMDLSYKQFFKCGTNNLERMGVPKLAGCSPGVYMAIDDGRKELANNLIQNGWIPFTNENIKKYFDGFALSYRNGLFYEIMGNVNYITPYNADDYRNFLAGEDDMFKHEPKEGLGKQMRPLKDPHMRFNIK